jgi:hypothetical protein
MTYSGGIRYYRARLECVDLQTGTNRIEMIATCWLLPLSRPEADLGGAFGGQGQQAARSGLSSSAIHALDADQARSFLLIVSSELERFNAFWKIVVERCAIPGLCAVVAVEPFARRAILSLLFLYALCNVLLALGRKTSFSSLFASGIHFSLLCTEISIGC